MNYSDLFFGCLGGRDNISYIKINNNHGISSINPSLSISLNDPSQVDMESIIRYFWDVKKINMSEYKVLKIEFGSYRELGHCLGLNVHNAGADGTDKKVTEDAKESLASELFEESEEE